MAEVEQAEDIEMIDQYFSEKIDKQKSIPFFSKVEYMNDLKQISFAFDREVLSEQAAIFFLSLDINNDGILTQSERVAAWGFTPETLPNGVDEWAADFMSLYDANSDDFFTLEEWINYHLYIHDNAVAYSMLRQRQKQTKPKLMTLNELNPLQNRIDDESIAKLLSDHDYNYIDR